VIDELPDNVVGFVYCITNLTNDRKYIGKKLAKRSKTKTVKGKKKKIKVSSDWKTYYGSSDELVDDVKKLGNDKFYREILRLCYSLTECTYYEAKEQFVRGVLESDDYYNAWIMARCRKSNLKSKNNDNNKNS
jgi:hypothetical protein